MARGPVVFGVVLVAMLGAFVAGVGAGTYKLFPVPQLSALKDRVLGARPARTPPTRISRAEGRALFFTTVAPDVDIVMVGDSITEAGLWTDLLPGRSIANRGIWGDTTGDVIARLDPILAVKAERAFLLLGINDLMRGAAVQDVFDNIVRITRALAATGTEVVVQSTLLCSRAQCLERRDDIAALNDALADFARNNGHEFLDLNRLLSHPEAGVLPEFTYDGLHLTGAGYLVWAEALAAHLGPR